MRICVIDGQGGGIGSVLIKAMRAELGQSAEILALGTNAAATSQMMKVGANRGASGENAICHSVRKADVIAGPLGIILANAMMGEVSSRIAEAVSSSPATKLLLPLTRERVEVIGAVAEPLPHLVDKLVHRLKELK